MSRTRLLVGVILPLILLPGVYGQTVQITNTTRGGSVAFYVGDTWTVTIAGGAANSQVVITANGSSSALGNTDASGNFSLSGYMSAGDVGTWNETWTVGGTAASPNPLTFYVYPAAAATCDLYAQGSTAVFSIDYVDSFTGYYGFQSRGYTSVGGALSPSDWCVMYGDSWDIGPSMYGMRTILSTHLVQWQVGDNGYRPFYSPPPEYYYPYFDYSAFGFVAVNITSGQFYFVPVVVGLAVNFIYAY